MKDNIPMEKNSGPSPDGETKSQGLHVIASDTLVLSGNVQRLVTFLNRSLKDEGYIFGLRRADDEHVHLTIYRS